MPVQTPEILLSAQRQLGYLAGLFAIAGGLAIIALMSITVVAVFWRYILNDPIFGIEDVSTMVLTVVVGAAVAYGAQHQAHVSVNIITVFFGRKVTRITDLLVRVSGLVIIAIAAYGLFSKGGCGLPCGAITNNLSIVHTPFYYFLGVGMAFYALLLLLHLLIGLVHWSGDDPNELRD